MSEIKLEVPIHHDEYTAHVSQMFDFEMGDKSITVVKNNLELPENWQLGVIYGPSGAGKSTLLGKFGKPQEYEWDERGIVSNLGNVSPSEATRLLSAVGLSSVPSWTRPFHCLSVGEQFRAKLARLLAETTEDDIILIDEFTSVVDRNVAKAASYAFAKYIRRTGRRAILATCHSDILEWLEPDWGYNPIEGVTHHSGRWKRPPIELKIFRGKYQAWELFAPHHYLTATINKSARVYLAYWKDTLVGFTCVLRFPHGHIKNGWRLSRSVVLPDYQGLGIGAKLTDFIASCITSGKDKDGNYGRCYARTTHPAMIAHRLKTGWWREAAGSRRAGNESKTGSSSMAGNKGWSVDSKVRYSFEYTGPKATEEHAKLFWE